MSMNHSKNYCIIMAGGQGRRLWPYSRKNCPKQFIDFFGVGRSLLQLTYDRISRIVPVENIYISTFKDYRELVAKQLPELPAENILAEPVQLSTAPAVMMATCYIAGRDPEANIIATPTDHHIIHPDRFEQQVREGLEFVAAHKEFLAMGVKPTVPNTAYGYIQTQEKVEQNHLFRVKSFSEKPALEYAKLFVESGEFVWNTGLFLWNVRTMLAMVNKLSPTMTEDLSRQGKELSASEDLEIIHRYYPSSLNRSIDLLILDKCENVCVKECDFGWADMGCWPELREVLPKDVDGNACTGQGKALLTGCRNNVVSVPEGVAAVVKDLNGYLIAFNGNTLVVCPNTDPTTVKHLANEVSMKLGREHL